MSGIGLRAIDGQFIRGLSNYSESASPAKALSGQGSGDSITVGLRVGAATYAKVVLGLNNVINVLNVSGSALQALDEIAEDAIALAERASNRGTSKQSRENLDVEFRRLGKQFREVVENTKIDDRDLLSTDGLKEIFTLIGLDSEKSESIGRIFEEFVTPVEEDLLASEEVQGERPIPIPKGAFPPGSPDAARKPTEFDQIFDGNISTRPDAYKAITDLKALREQIQDNLKAVDGAMGALRENVELVRAAGFAFLELSDQVKGTEDADQLAEQIRQAIRRNATAALSHAENLEPLAVAALAVDEDSEGNPVFK